ncbi:MAG: hypothetical protein EOO20_00305 [Chryseobacterium sp.]|nr:MAG: hypothetical protein EOO20_00305 [Chryseobacterium sp.]
MNITLTSHQIQLMLQDAAELGATQALSKLGKIKPTLKKKQAFRRYGRRNVEYWISLGLIAPFKDTKHSSAWRINRLEADALSKSYGAMRYL